MRKIHNLYQAIGILCKVYIDVSDVKWDSSQKVLSGTSKVVGGETYKLVIATNGYTTVSSTAQNAETEIIKGANPKIVELVINRAENGTVDWSISFKKDKK